MNNELPGHIDNYPEKIQEVILFYNAVLEGIESIDQFGGFIRQEDEGNPKVDQMVHCLLELGEIEPNIRENYCSLFGDIEIAVDGTSHSLNISGPGYDELKKFRDQISELASDSPIISMKNSIDEDLNREIVPGVKEAILFAEKTVQERSAEKPKGVEENYLAKIKSEIEEAQAES